MTALDPKPPAEIPPELAHHPRYRVQGQLGAGGMGVVYKAEHVLMGRTVAVKMIAQRFTANAVAVERFRREVRAAAKLAHPNIVTAYDADEAGGRHFLVMEFVDGVSLDRVVNRRGPLPVATACHVVRMTALGLQHAHGKGMVHRDIKPQNVMVNRKSQVKVLDFGLARLATDGDLPADDAGGSHHPGVTGTNTVVGTPDYLSPEQTKGGAVDPRSDVYSLGCLFYFALTGRPPFAAAQTAFDKLVAHNTEEPPPVALYRADVPPEVVAVLTKMLAKDPADRPASAADVAAALLPFSKASPSEVTTAPAVSPASSWDFETAGTATNTTQSSARLRRPDRPWKAYATLLLVLVGLPFLLVLVAASLNTSRRDAATSAPPPSAAKPAAPPPAARVLFALPRHRLRLDDYEPTRARLAELGAKVTTAGKEKGPSQIFGDPRSSVPVEFALADVKPDDFDAVLFVGQDVSDFIQNNTDGVKQAERVVQAMAKAKKVVGGIGVGVRVLTHFGLLRNRQAAQPDEERKRFEKPEDANWTLWRRVATDGPFVTARSAQDAREFADAVHAAITSAREGK